MSKEKVQTRDELIAEKQDLLLLYDNEKRFGYVRYKKGNYAGHASAISPQFARREAFDAAAKENLKVYRFVQTGVRKKFGIFGGTPVGKLELVVDKE